MNKLINALTIRGHGGEFARRAVGNLRIIVLTLDLTDFMQFEHVMFIVLFVMFVCFVNAMRINLV